MDSENEDARNNYGQTTLVRAAHGAHPNPTDHAGLPGIEKLLAAE